MENSLAGKLYSEIETLDLSNSEVGPLPTGHSVQSDLYDIDGDDVWCEDGYPNDDSEEGVGNASDLDREWQRRHSQFHTIGYRDGLVAGKEASAQEGFNIGFKQSVLVGYNWGLVRGVTSALNCLPDDLKEKLAGMIENKQKFKNLHESVHSVSTKNALRMFHDDTLISGQEQINKPSEGNFEVATTSHQIRLGRYFKELESLLKTSAIDMHSALNL